MKQSYKLALLAAGIVIILITSFVGTSQPAFCTSCHEMQGDVNAWKNSAHVKVNCADCHIGQSLTKKAFHKVIALKEVYSHVVNNYVTPINMQGKVSEEMPDERCRVCHASVKNVTNGRIKMSHEQHAKIKCAYCHNRTGHPGLEGYEDRTSMEFCVACHKQQKVSAECTSCHTPEFNLRPSSHQQANWDQIHKISKGSECYLCHNDAYCDNCHERREQ